MRGGLGGPVLGAALGAALFPSLASAVGFDSPSVAYVDPGAGSFILQALVASLAGAVVVIGTYWKRIKAFFGASTRSDQEETAGPESADD